jgi:hypothetical protein
MGWKEQEPAKLDAFLEAASKTRDIRVFSSMRTPWHKFEYLAVNLTGPIDIVGHAFFPVIKPS